MSRLVRVLAAIAALTLAITVISATTSPRSAEAATASQFNPGMIISDALFFDGTAMTADSVQNFLNSQVKSCAAGYTCLKSYTMDTAGRAANGTLCAALGATTAESAASVIARVGAACGISQKALLVLLQKEQGLVTSTSPSSGAYRAATGYGCPDTSACDSTYYGFFNQVYMAALQFKRYAAKPANWNHVAGRVNNIRVHPNAACGASSVLIQNQATAGLYNYTPYTPNAAALTNLYGTGDGCSSYGNRNFWRYYTDWFGSTTTSDIVRSADNAAVYLVSGGVKYYVPSMEILGILSPLGSVSYVSNAYLNGLETGPNAGRVFRGPDGSIYFIDAGIKLPFVSCQQVYDYGGSCDATGYVQLTAAQVAVYVNGPALSSVLGTTAGSRYYVKNGVKSEILDDASQLAAGIPLGLNVLTEAALSQLPVGNPIVRDSVFVGVRGTDKVSFVTTAGQQALSSGAAVVAGAQSKIAGSLNQASMSKIAARGSFTGAITADNGQRRLISLENTAVITAGSVLDQLASTAVSPALSAVYSGSGSVGVGSFIKAVDSSTIYLVAQANIRPVSSWNALTAIAPGGDTSFRTVSAEVVAALPVGPSVLEIGGLYRTSSNPAVYMIDGASKKIPVSTFNEPVALGFSSLYFVSDADLAAYSASAVPLGYGVTCGQASYVSAGGSLHSLVGPAVAAYALTTTALDAATCARLSIGAPASEFVRVPSGVIYKMENGKKRPFSSLASYNAANAAAGFPGWLSVPAAFTDSYATGPAL